jgi:hypothetical protein
MSVHDVAAAIINFPSRLPLLFFQNCFKSTLSTLLPFSRRPDLIILAAQTILGAPNNYYSDFIISLFCQPDATGTELSRRISAFESPNTRGILASLNPTSLPAFLTHFNATVSAALACTVSSTSWDQLITALRPFTLTYSVGQKQDRYVDMVGFLRELHSCVLRLSVCSEASASSLDKSSCESSIFDSAILCSEHYKAALEAWDRCKTMLSISTHCHGYSDFSGCSLFFPFGLYPLQTPVSPQIWPFSSLLDNRAELTQLFEYAPAYEALCTSLMPMEQRFRQQFEAAVAALPVPSACSILAAEGEAGVVPKVWVPKWKRDRLALESEAREAAAASAVLKE